MKNAYKFLLKELESSNSVVVAVSGGPDSMALIDLMSKIKKIINIEIICAHVNHNVRKESFFEKIEVEKFCNKNNIIFESMIIENYSDDNFQNEARNIRYNFFDNLVKKYNSNYLLTAHHADDLVETVLMRIVRGSTLRGYSGFSKKTNNGNYYILRPLIEVSKEEILKYNEENKIEYATDLSNYKDTYTRNRFRKYIVPELKKEEPNIYKKIYKYSSNLLEYNEYVEKQVSKEILNVYQNKTLLIKKINELDHLIIIRIIARILEIEYGDKINLVNDNHLDSIYKLLNSEKANASICLPNKLKCIKEYDRMFIKQENNVLNEYKIEIKNNIILSSGKNIMIVDKSDLTNNFVCRLNKEEIKLPLFIRNRKNGDKISVKGMEGTKKINEIFINEKINVNERKEWPILVDSNDIIVWIPGLKKSKLDKSKEEKYDIILEYC